MDCSQPASSVHGILQGSGLPCPPPGDLPDQGIEPMLLMSPVLAGRFFTTSATSEAHYHVCIYIILIAAPYCSVGEGNGTPLQYSCLENPMDGGAWWAAVHGVAQSRT